MGPNILNSVIILNGPSASGKTSLQKAIQESFDVPYLKLGIDSFFNDLLPDAHANVPVYPKGAFDPRSIRFVEEVEVKGKPSAKLFVGSVGQKVIKGMNSAIAAYAAEGNNLVVDYIAYEKKWAEDLVQKLRAVPTASIYFIKVHLPLEILEERERMRSTSPVGHARSHYFDVHEGFAPYYDFEVSTEKDSPEILAKKIKTYIAIDSQKNKNKFINL